MTARRLHVECLAWRPCVRNTLRGFADFRISEIGLAVRDCPVHEKTVKRWVALPARPRLDKDRNLVSDAQTGKIEYSKVLGFEDRAQADAFRDAAIAALMKREPDALAAQQEADECSPLLI